VFFRRYPQQSFEPVMLEDGLDRLLQRGTIPKAFLALFVLSKTAQFSSGFGQLVGPHDQLDRKAADRAVLQAGNSA
jgi:hypothetical protein